VNEGDRHGKRGLIAPFFVFINKGIELKRFDGIIESLKFGISFSLEKSALK
jgi:Na+/H+ antiporter NhaA